MDAKLWNTIIKTMENSFSRPVIVTWLKPAKLIDDGGGLFTLTTPNDYAKSWIETHALEKISQVLAQEVPEYQKVRVVIAKPAEKENDLPLLEFEPQGDVEKPVEAVKKLPHKELNPKYTFESFIVGNNNRLAFAASQAVAEKPGTAYNPLFLYGGVGMGKTHLMQAIGNTVLTNTPNKSIIYTSCEAFTNDFIQSLKEKTIDSFKKKYRQADVLLVDDIQFLSNKEGTQEEFFHTFNILHQSNRQIIITSDRVPKDIPELEERLISRFGWGMIADIQSPNYETRLAILEQKATEKNLTIDHEALEYIANAVTSNIRELEGCLTKLAATAEFEGVKVDRAVAESTLKDLISTGENLTSKKVIHSVAKYFNIEVGDILGSKRIKELVYPRQIVMYLLRENMKMSYPQIGDILGGKDHTTIMYGFNKIDKGRKSKSAIEQDLKNLLNQMKE